MSKNIVDVYKETYGQFIIVVSGLSGSGKTNIGSRIENDFGLKLIDTNKFYKKDNSEKIKLSNGAFVINYDTDDAMDWDKLNTEANAQKTSGVVIVGQVFPTDKLLFVPDYHVHLKITKQTLKDNRTKYIDKHPDTNMDKMTEMLRVNVVTYPYYLLTLKRMKIDKFIDVSGSQLDELYDMIFDDIIKHVSDKVYSKKRATDSTTETTDDVIQYTNDYIISYTEDDI